MGTPLVQTMVLERLERSADIEISGKNLSPFSLTHIRFENIKITEKDMFILNAENAVLTFSAVETLLGQIPLVVRARNLKLILKEDALISFFSEVPLETLDAKIKIFSGKGVWIESLDLKGKDLELTAHGKLIKEGKGESDLKAKLVIPADFPGKGFKVLTQNIFSKNTSPSSSAKPLTFEFELRGDRTHPQISLQSDLVSFDVREGVTTS